MNIIFVSNNMAKARTLSLPQCLLLLAVLLTVPPLLTAALILPQADSEHHGVSNLLPLRLLDAVHAAQPQQISALALQIGQMQARLMRLDALSARLAEMAGIRDQEFGSGRLPGQGGPAERAQALSAAELEQEAARMMHELDERSERLGMLESLLLQQRVKRITFPSGLPLQSGYNSSSFGWRVDPFTGQKAFHRGLDFMAEEGTPILAAADGIVVQAERMPDYGNILRIDHGSGLDTRYAHVSRFLVGPGERVSKGQPIAEVGNTGRSTGAHLHFEVRLNGVALDPRQYMKNSNG